MSEEFSSGTNKQTQLMHTTIMFMTVYENMWVCSIFQIYQTVQFVTNRKSNKYINTYSYTLPVIKFTTVMFLRSAY